MQPNFIPNLEIMAIMTKLNRTDLRELRDHRDNTLGEYVKCYTLSQISFMDGIDTRTVKTCGRYLPVRIDNSRSLHGFKRGAQSHPYMTMWIRLDEIKDLFKKRNKGKRLTVE